MWSRKTSRRCYWHRRTRLLLLARALGLPQALCVEHRLKIAVERKQMDREEYQKASESENTLLSDENTVAPFFFFGLFAEA